MCCRKQADRKRFPTTCHSSIILYHTGAATTADCGDYDILLGLLAGGVRRTINLVSFGITLRQRQAKDQKNTLVIFSDTGFAML